MDAPAAHDTEPHPYLRRPLLHICGLPSRVRDDEIAVVFQPCGDFRLDIQRGFPHEELKGTIEFQHLNQAEKALVCLHSKPFPGLDPSANIILSPFSQTIGMPYPSGIYAHPRLVKFLSEHYTYFQLYDLFRPYGALASISIHATFPQETSVIEFWHEDEARKAENAMHCTRADVTWVPHPAWSLPTESSSVLENLKIPTWKRLCSHALLPHEIISLVGEIFTNKDEVKMICDLRGDEAQAFVDVIHRTLFLPDLPPRLGGKCLAALCRVCGRQAILPGSLRVPICYDRSNAPLYRGGFADVWKGEYQYCDVAVKVLRVYSTSDLSKITSRFCREVVTWNALRHPNVLTLWGVITDHGQFAMVSEWMQNGNINEFVKVHGEANRFELLKDVVKGLIYIHGQAMIHGDLKGGNILIDQNRRARLADFGLLTIVSDPTYFTASSSVPTGGTTRWMSPELLNPEQFGLDHCEPTKESDCYALGMVIYEVLSGQVPFTPLKEHIVTQKVLGGERPVRPGGVSGTWFSGGLWEMLGLCWATQAQARPNIQDVLECLEQVSGTWEPLPLQVNEDIEKDEDEWADMLLTKSTRGDP